MAYRCIYSNGHVSSPKNSAQVMVELKIFIFVLAEIEFVVSPAVTCDSAADVFETMHIRK